MFVVQKNSSVPLARPLSKIFDSGLRSFVEEPDEVIDPRIDYRAMSISSQIENGTIGKDVSFENYGVDALDMSDAVSSSMIDLGQQLEEKDIRDKEIEYFNQVMQSMNSNPNQEIKS